MRIGHASIRDRRSTRATGTPPSSARRGPSSPGPAPPQPVPEPGLDTGDISGGWEEWNPDARKPRTSPSGRVRHQQSRKWGLLDASVSSIWPPAVARSCSAIAVCPCWDMHSTDRTKRSSPPPCLVGAHIETIGWSFLCAIVNRWVRQMGCESRNGFTRTRGSQLRHFHECATSAPAEGPLCRLEFARSESPGQTPGTEVAYLRKKNV